MDGLELTSESVNHRQDDPTNFAVENMSELLDQVNHHSVFNNEYFQALESDMPWEPNTYDAFRANFFRRIQLTRDVIAQACARAADEGDTPSLVLLANVLNEECGDGNIDFCHERLLEASFNNFGERIFGLAPLLLTDARTSPLLNTETEEYHMIIRQLCSGSYQRMLGVLWAIETHAEPMLTTIRRGFRTLSGTIDPKEFVEKIEIYFNVHLNSGVEERHASDSLRCVTSNISSKQDFDEAMAGALGGLKAQETFWMGLIKQAGLQKGVATLPQRLGRVGLYEES